MELRSEQVNRRKKEDNKALLATVAYFTIIAHILYTIYILYTEMVKMKTVDFCYTTKMTRKVQID